MALSMNESRTRRGLVAGALGGLAGVLGAAAGRPERAVAGENSDPDAVHKNVNNPTTASTTVTCNGATSIRAISNGGGTTKSGVFAQANGTSSRGVTGVGVTGVLGQSNAAGGNGVLGFVPGANATAVFANATSTTGAPRGVVGRSVAPNGIGVRGENLATSGDAAGVFGQTRSPDGEGVVGVHTTPSGFGSGVRGETSSPAGKGVAGLAQGGTGVLGEASGPTGVGGVFSGVDGAVALEVAGPIEVSDSAGTATIPAGSSSVVVNPGLDITTSHQDPLHAELQSRRDDHVASRDQERRGRTPSRSP